MPSPTPILVSIVIPCLNEARRLPGTLGKLLEYVKTLPFAVEIVVVVERSSDRTAEVAAAVAHREDGVIVIANELWRGKGFAIRTGVLRARGSVIFTMDADLSVPVACIGEFIKHFEERPDVDVLTGNRQHLESDIVVRQKRLRELMGQGFNVAARAIVGGKLRDTQCGFKAFRRRAAIEIFTRQTIDGFACDVEILMLAARLGFVVQDLPVRWFNSPESKVRLLWDPWRMMFDLFRVRGRVARALRRSPPRND